MTITLDRSRHFSQIFGQTENGAIFHQDGIDFRGDGTAILSKEEEKRKAEQAAAEQAAAEQAAAEQAAAEQAAAEEEKRKAEQAAAADKKPITLLSKKAKVETPDSEQPVGDLV